MARAFLSFSLLLRSMSSISLIFCKGSPGRLLSWQDTMVGACHLRGQPWCLLAGAPPIDSTLPHFLGFPTWEISARMIPRYCLPCPRASMAAKNSFLSWTSFTTAQRGRAISAQGSGVHRGTGSTWPLRESGVGVGAGRSIASHVLLLAPSVLHTHTHILQTGPARELAPLAAHGEPFYVPLCPFQWQRYFGVFVSPSPDLL